ncbi:MAG: phosphate signaling complex protein PhoU [Symbiobacteriia bacterium]
MAREIFHQQLEELQQELLKMGTLVEEAIHRAVRSLSEKDSGLAREVIESDDRIDDAELDIERRCLALFALQQPMAADLRLVGTALKFVTDLERMGDHAVDIAKTTLRLDGQPLIKPLVDIPRMAELAQLMMREALSAYVNRDAEQAYAMIARDDEVDHLYGQVFRELLTYMMEDPRTIKQATYLIFVAMYLERIADHATNLGEWTIYMVTGERKELNN